MSDRFWVTKLPKEMPKIVKCLRKEMPKVPKLPKMPKVNVFYLFYEIRNSR